MLIVGDLLCTLALAALVAWLFWQTGAGPDPQPPRQPMGVTT